MSFKPFGKKYAFNDAVLLEDFPDFMLKSLSNWILNALRYSELDVDIYSRVTGIKHSFQNYLEVQFREVFPRNWSEFLRFVFSDKDRTCNILALCLQGYAREDQANQLESILSESGSAYEVMITNRQAKEYDTGAYNLTMRVPSSVKMASEKALSENEILNEAWAMCYSRNPNYEKVVSSCCDFLEGYLGKQYFPKDAKPQLKKFVHSLGSNPAILNYKGETLITPKSNLTDLLKEASNIRGQHTQGQGRKPTKDEAEFVLYTTIYIWNLHRGVS